MNSANPPSQGSDDTSSKTGESGERTPDSLEVSSIGNSEESDDAAHEMVPPFTNCVEFPDPLSHAHLLGTTTTASRPPSSLGSNGGSDWDVVELVEDGEELSLDHGF